MVKTISPGNQLRWVAMAAPRRGILLAAQVVFILISVLIVTSPPDAPVFAAPSVSWLHVEGNHIVNQSGTPVTLRGVNIEGWNWSWSNGPTLAYERRAIPEATGAPPNGWGANVILIAVASGPINRGDATYLSYIDQMVQMAKQNGAYTLLEWRSDEPNGSQPSMPDQAAQDAMATLAARYANEPAVLYGLQVEPHDVTWQQLKPRLTSMIDAIRARNPRSLIMVPGTDWSRYTYWMLDDPIQRDNLVLQSHVYDDWNAIRADFQFPELAARYPLILGEFGTGGNMNQSDVNHLLDLAESLHMSWIGWLFQDQGCPCMLKDTNTFEPTAYGQSIKDRLQAAALASQTAAARTVPIRINVGGPALTDSQGNHWLADQPYARGDGWGYLDTTGDSGQASNGVALAGTEYQTERWGLSGYRVELPNGTYNVRLHFAETYSGITGPGQRVFGVSVQGKPLGNALDIYKRVGFDKPLVLQASEVSVTDGVLEIRLTPGVQEPILDGIEVLPATSGG